MGKSIDDFDFVITGSIRTDDKQKTMDLLDNVLRNEIPGISFYHINLGNMTFYYLDKKDGDDR